MLYFFWSTIVCFEIEKKMKKKNELKLKDKVELHIFSLCVCVEIMAIEWHGKFCKQEDDRIFIFLSYFFF